MIVGFFFIRTIPLPSEHSESAPETAVEDPSANYQGPSDSRAPLLGHYPDDVEVGSPTPRHKRDLTIPFEPYVPEVRDLVELSPTSSIPDEITHETRQRSRSSRRSFGMGAKMLYDGLPNIHGRALFFSGDFWLVFTILSLCTCSFLLSSVIKLTRRVVSGTGLMCRSYFVFRVKLYLV